MRHKPPEQNRFTSFVPWLWLPLLLILPAIFFVDQKLVWTLILLPVLGFVRWLGVGRPIPRTPLNLPIFILAIALLVNIFTSPDAAAGLSKYAGLTYGIALYFATYDAIETRFQLRIGTWLFAVLGGGLAFLGMLGVPFAAYTKFPWLSQISSALPTFLVQGNPVNANMIGGILTWIVPMLVILTIAAWRDGTGRRWAVAFGAVVTVGMLVLSQSRGAMLGTVGALVLVLPFAFARRENWRRASVINVAVCLLGGAIALWFWWGTASFFGRIEIWDRALLFTEDVPLTGVGSNLFRQLLPRVYPLFLTSPTKDIAHAHNEWLTVAVELGLPALLAYTAILLGAIRQLWGVIHHCGSQVRPLAAGLLAGLVAHSFYGLWDAIALGAKPGFLLWVLLGLAMGSGRITRSQPPTPFPSASDR